MKISKNIFNRILFELSLNESWIGYHQNRRNPERIWEWAGNEISTFLNWAGFEKASNTSDCVYLHNSKHIKEWYDSDCNTKLPFLCLTKDLKSKITFKTVVQKWVGWKNLTKYNNNQNLFGYLFQSNENWFDANLRCQEFGAVLASFESSEIFDKITSVKNLKNRNFLKILKGYG